MKIIERVQEFKPKRIFVFENGQTECFTNQSMCISPKRTRTWNTVLQFITTSLKPRFGVVERLICRSDAVSVHSFSELRPNEKYIALSSHREKVVPGCYRTKSEMKMKIKDENNQDYTDLTTRDWALEQARKNKRTIIFIFVNGRRRQAPMKFVLTNTDFKRWKSTLNYMSTMLDMPKGIYTIYTTYGKKIEDPYDLQHGASYVVTSFNDSKFEDLGYLDSFDTITMYKNGETVNKINAPAEGGTLGTQEPNLSPSRHKNKNKKVKRNLRKKIAQMSARKKKYNDEGDDDDDDDDTDSSSEDLEDRNDVLDGDKNTIYKEHILKPPQANIRAKNQYFFPKKGVIMRAHKLKVENISSEGTKMESKSSQCSKENINSNISTPAKSEIIIDNLSDNNSADGEVAVQTVPKNLQDYKVSSTSKTFV